MSSIVRECGRLNYLSSKLTVADLLGEGIFCGLVACRVSVRSSDTNTLPRQIRFTHI